VFGTAIELALVVETIAKFLGHLDPGDMIGLILLKRESLENFNRFLDEVSFEKFLLERPLQEKIVQSLDFLDVLE
jgi:hypothetical protein